MLEVCGSSLLWRFLSMGALDEWLVKISWLGMLASVFWWVELELFSLECMKCPIVSFERFVGLV